MRKSSLAGLVAMAAGLSAGMGFAGGNVLAGSPGLSAQTQKAMAGKPVKGERTTMRAMLGSGFGSANTSQRRAGYGWTNRHAQRVARKKRNQARHRAAGRG